MTLSNQVNIKALTANQLKCIAIIAMVIDHIGAVFFPGTAIFRIIGRLTMPIMAFFIAEGYHYTKDVRRYMIRLLIFALVSAYPYSLYFGYGPFNILFSLLAGLAAITAYDRSSTGFQRIISLAIPMLIASALQFDGQFIVVFLVYVFHRHRGDFKLITINMLMLYAVIEYMLVSNAMAMGNGFDFTVWVQLYALMTLPLLKRYNGKINPPHLPRFTFYIFYPLHISILLALKLLIN